MKSDGAWNWRLGNPAAGRNSPASIRLDAVRWIAAMAVFLGHLKALMFVDFKDVAHPNPLVRGFYFVLGLGHEAVVVFFVLSGFFITQSIIRSESKGKFGFVDYAIVRLSRLQVVLIPAIALTFSLDWIGINILHAPAYGGGYANVIFTPVASSSDWRAALGNILFLQGILVPTFGSNGPLWSLSYEFWYYVAFPLFFLGLVARRLNVPVRFVMFGLALTVGWFVGAKISIYFAVWLLGFLLGVLPPAARLGSVSVVATGLVFLASLAQGKLRPISSDIGQDFLIGVTFSLFMFTLMHAKGRSGQGALSRVIAWGAGSSFTLYVVHLPLCLLAVSMLLPSGERLQPSLANLLQFVAVVLVVIVLSSMVWWATENRTPVVRDWLKGRIEPSASS